MKPVLVVDTCEVEALQLAGKVYDVVSYKDATPERIGKQHVLYWPTSRNAVSRAANLAEFALEVKRLVADGKTAKDFLHTPWLEFVAWAKPRVIEADPDIVLDPAPSLSQKERIEQLGLACTESGNPYCNSANVVRYLERTPRFKRHIWFDEFQHTLLTDINGSLTRWSDNDENNLLIYLQDQLAFHRLNEKHVKSAVSYFSQQDRRHEVRDWVTSLAWDGTKRIAGFFPAYFGAQPTGANHAFSLNFWVLLLKRIFEPGCQADYMVVLEGGQGIGKTRAFHAIGGDEWYAEVGIDASSQDFERQLQGRILVEISELHSFSKANQSRIKQIITKRNDVYVEKYKEHAANHPRQCILVGTTNESEWIKDQTGGRRFWPIACGTIDVDAVKRDRAQLFAEAYHIYKSGEEGFITPTEETAALQDERRESDAWEELLAAALIGIYQITRAEAMAKLGIPPERMDGKAEKRVCAVLRHLGWTTKPYDHNGQSKRAWFKNGCNV